MPDGSVGRVTGAQNDKVIVNFGALQLLLTSADLCLVPGLPMRGMASTVADTVMELGGVNENNSEEGADKNVMGADQKLPISFSLFPERATAQERKVT